MPTCQCVATGVAVGAQLVRDALRPLSTLLCTAKRFAAKGFRLPHEGQGALFGCINSGIEVSPLKSLPLVFQRC